MFYQLHKIFSQDVTNALNGNPAFSVQFMLFTSLPLFYYCLSVMWVFRLDMVWIFCFDLFVHCSLCFAVYSALILFLAQMWLILIGVVLVIIIIIIG